MKHFIGLLLIFTTATTIFGQSKKFSFKLGTEYELPRKTEDLAFFGNDKDGIVNLSLKKDELNIIRFDPQTLKQTSEKTIDLPEATRNFNSETLIDFNNGNYYRLHSDWNRDSEKELLYTDKIDVTTGKITESSRKLLETTKIAGDKASMGWYSVKTIDKYRYNYNADRTKLMISYRLVPEERNDKKNYDKIGFVVFDDHMNKLWGNEFRMPYTEAIMDNSDFAVDVDGNAYLLAKVYESDSRKERDKATGRPGYHYEVMKFTKDSKTINHTQIGVGDYFIRESSLIESPTHDMIIASTYSLKSKGNGTDGIFLALLDPSGKVVKYKNGNYEFPLSELEKFESARNRRKMERKDDYEIPNLKVRSIGVEPDGSVIIACEEYYVVAYYSNTNSIGYSRVTYTYYYEDILVTRINASGKFDWLRKIPKMQRGSAGRGTMSFKAIGDESGYYFLYLDNKKNMDLAVDETPKYHVDGYGGQVVISKITREGKVSKELLFDTRDEEIMVFPADFSRINGNQFIGRAKVKKRLFQPLLITVH